MRSAFDRWFSDLESALRKAAILAGRGVEEYRHDPALPLAFEALVNRVDDPSTRLTGADDVRFAD